MKALSDKCSLLTYLWFHKPLNESIGRVCSGGELSLIRKGEIVVSRGFVLAKSAEMSVGGVIIRGNIMIAESDKVWHSASFSERESVVLFVCEKTESERFLSPAGGVVECYEQAVPREAERRYRDLSVSGEDYLCPEFIGRMESHMSALLKTRMLVERLSDKCAHLRKLKEDAKGGDSDMAVAALFDTVMISSTANRKLFGELSAAIGFNRIVASLITGDKEADKVSIEALLFGTAGFLTLGALDEEDDYVYMLRGIFERLKKGHGITPIQYGRWNRASYRNNTPDLLIAQMAALLCDAKPLYHRLCECTSLADLKKLFTEPPSRYWRTHYALGKSCGEVSTGHLISKEKTDRILINFMLPFVFDRQRHDYGEEAEEFDIVEMFEQIPAEKNAIVNKYDAHAKVVSAFDSQAFIQLNKRYCRENRCWQCPVGCAYMSGQ